MEEAPSDTTDVKKIIKPSTSFALSEASTDRESESAKPQALYPATTEVKKSVVSIANNVYHNMDEKKEKDEELPKNPLAAQRSAARVKSSMMDPAEDEAKFEAVKSGARRQSKAMSANSSSNNENRFAREVSETVFLKFKAMIWCFLAAISNSALMVGADAMKSGMPVQVGGELIKHIAAVIIEILLLISNILTIKAIDSGISAYFGLQLASTGNSMATMGFAQAAPVLKLNFANNLSLNSNIRKFLSRIAYIWIIMEICKILTPFSATAVYSEELREDQGSVNCIVFDQIGEPIDRNWPVMDVEAGIAELVFGSSLGRLRSEEDVSETMFLVAPQLAGVVVNGDTIVGPGFSVNMTTNCLCSRNDAPAALVAAGANSSVSSDFTAAVRANFGVRTLINQVQDLPETEELLATTILTGTSLCGGKRTSGVPVCLTRFKNHRRATVMMAFMTDGTTASIAQDHVYLREYVDEPAHMSPWGAQALQSMIGQGVQTYEVPSTVPAMISPLLYWATSDLLALDPSLIEAGIETFWAMIFRAGIQRTYATYGHTCTRNIINHDAAIIHFKEYGYIITVTVLALQLVANFLGILAFIPWLMSNVPAGPAIRALTESSYFTALLADSNVGDCLKGLSNAPSHAIWQTLDRKVRIGESVSTQDDEIGHITMDKLKLVIPLENARKYS